MGDQLECLDGPENCNGPVEMHSLDGLNAWPRCEFHFDARMDRYEASDLERYANSDVAPSWFDPELTGERWDDDY